MKTQQPKLTIELVPKTSWGNNLRKVLSSEEWKQIQTLVFKRADYKCEICGGIGKEHPVECHEIWEYDDVKHRQILIGFQALCPQCHAVKHIGRTSSLGQEVLGRALSHLQKINKWNPSMASHYVNTCLQIYAKRSLFEWKVKTEALDAIKEQIRDNLGVGKSK